MAGCLQKPEAVNGGTPEAVNGSKPEPRDEKADEVRADVLVRSGGGSSAIEITFYTPISEILNGKENKGFGKNVIAVQDPRFNGTPLTQATNLSKQPFYKTDISKAVAQNVISATVKGKPYEGTTMLELHGGNKMTTLVLDPK